MTLDELTIIRAPIERCFDLARSVEVHLAGNVHFGETAVATAGVTSGLLGMSQRVTWRAKHFGVWQTLTSEITAMDRPGYFQDTMTQGIFRFMRHDHFFRAAVPARNGDEGRLSFRRPAARSGPHGRSRLPPPLHAALLRERNAVIKANRRIRRTGGNIWR